MKKILIIIVAFILLVPYSFSRAEEDPVEKIMNQFLERLDKDGLLELRDIIKKQSNSLRAIKHLREFVVTHLPEEVKAWYDKEIYLLELELFQNKKLFLEAYKITKELEKKLQEIFKEKEKKLFKFETNNV